MSYSDDPRLGRLATIQATIDRLVIKSVKTAATVEADAMAPLMADGLAGEVASFRGKRAAWSA